MMHKENYHIIGKPRKERGRGNLAPTKNVTFFYKRMVALGLRFFLFLDRGLQGFRISREEEVSEGLEVLCDA